jgi:hypothetical protein
MSRALVAVVVAMLAFGVAAAGSYPRASLRLASTNPIRVAGSYFQPGERVVVTYYAKRRAVRRVQASARGTFTAVFEPRLHDRCSGYFVRAIGNRGSRALLKTPLPACAPARTG